MPTSAVTSAGASFHAVANHGDAAATRLLALDLCGFLMRQYFREHRIDTTLAAYR
jgi:hypothetical protein